MKIVRWVLSNALLVGTLVAGWLLAAKYAQVCARIGLWAYPLTMGVYMTASFVTLLYLVPPEHKKSFVFPALRDRLRGYEKRLHGGVWAWFRAKGAFIAMLAATLFLNPVAGAIVARVVGLPERRVWNYVFSTNLVASAVWATIYTGLGNVLAALF